MKLGTFTFEITSLTNARLKANVIFDIFKEDGLYSAIPFLSEMELKLAQLPAAIFFRIEGGAVVTSNGLAASNSGLLNAIGERLRIMKII